MIKVIELFAGVGSQREALKRANIEHEIVAISENDKYASRAYELLHGPTNNLGDIKNIDKLSKADLRTYSFPCTDISLAGKMKGFDKGSNTHSSLLWEVQRLLEVAKENDELPKYLLMENVKNIVSKKFMPLFRVWSNYLDSLGYKNFYKVLNAKDYDVPQNRERCLENIKSPMNKRWRFSVIRKILKDETYTGKLILQKTYRPVIHSRKTNKGEVSKYMAEDAHEAIIDKTTFDRVQEEIKRRDCGYLNKAKDNLFKQIVYCGTCGGLYQRKKSYSTKNESYKWLCRKYLYAKKGHRCDSIGIPEDILISKTKELLGVDSLNYELIKKTFDKIIIHKEKTIEYRFKNGEVSILSWNFKSRKEIWTPKMREESRIRALKQYE